MGGGSFQTSAGTGQGIRITRGKDNTVCRRALGWLGNIRSSPRSVRTRSN